MELSRRNFVGAAACGTAALVAGAGAVSNIALADYAVSEPETWDEECEVLVLGAGGTGLSAACAAAEAGADTLVIDAADTFGGTTAMSLGLIQAAGTPWQKEFTTFQDDTPANHAACYLEMAEGVADEELVTTLCERAPELLEWLTTIGVNWIDVYGNCHVPYVTEGLAADRIHVPDGDGASMTQFEAEEAERLGARFEYNTTAKSLVFSSDKGVLGAIVEHDGADIAIKASKGVILALAGMDHNVTLAKAYNPQQYWDLTEQLCLASTFDNGDGILMGLAVNAALGTVGGGIDFDSDTWNGTENDLPTIPCLIVNSKGRRFMCEDATYSYTIRGIFQQEVQIGGKTFMIIDQNCVEQGLSPWEDLDAAVADGTLYTADTIEDLAEQIGVPPTNLQNTFDLWNANIEQFGEDLEYNRDTQLIPLDKPPYYAHINTSSNLGSFGGLMIDTKAEVIDNNGNVIPGLYAGGMNSGGWYGKYYPGSGTSLVGGLVWGHIAGENAAAAEAH